MTLRVRAPIDGLAEGERTIDAAASHYLVRVMRLREGDRLVVFDPVRAVEAEASIRIAAPTQVVLNVGPLRAATLTAIRDVTWIQGIAKGEKMDAIVRDATELGATAFLPTTSHFAVVKLEGRRREARHARWVRIAHQAARQCGRSDPPTVIPALSWAQALNHPPIGAARFCLYERATEPLRPKLVAALESSQALAFAAGTEGGLSTDEAAMAEGLGWAVVSLGSFVLRAETVVTAVLGAVRVLDLQ